jgi:bifunctional non-homologous end joining protein LigD
MKECRWLKPMLVGKFEFVEWTPDAHLRHSRFMGLRDGANPLDVARQHAEGLGRIKGKI